MRARVTASGIAAVLVLTGSNVSGQTADPMTEGASRQMRLVQSYILRTANKVPEELYGFRPTSEVRTLGQILGHVADDVLGFCTQATGEEPPTATIEQSVTGKAPLIAALTDSFAFCDQVLSSMSDRTGAELVPFRLGPSPRLSIVYFSAAHAYEHYGNLVTYMRIQGIVPPSSERRTPG